MVGEDRFYSRPSPTQTVVVLAVAAFVMFGASKIVTPPNPFGTRPDVKLTPDKAEALGAAYLAQFGLDPTGFRSVTKFDDDWTTIYNGPTWDFGADAAAQDFGAYFQNQPTWLTRWFKYDSHEQYGTKISDDGRLLFINEYIPVDIPLNTATRDEAVSLAREALIQMSFYTDGDWRVREIEPTRLKHRCDFTIAWQDVSANTNGIRRTRDVIVRGDRAAMITELRYEYPRPFRADFDFPVEIFARTKNAARIWITRIVIGIVSLRTLSQIFRRKVARSDLKFAVSCVAIFGLLPLLAEVTIDAPAYWRDFFSMPIGRYPIGSGTS
ncbi:hypothetical protein K8I61_00530 [bacterium]|nr:hypothetical protein [bacterium]